MNIYEKLNSDGWRFHFKGEYIQDFEYTKHASEKGALITHIGGPVCLISFKDKDSYLNFLSEMIDNETAPELNLTSEYFNF